MAQVTIGGQQFQVVAGPTEASFNHLAVAWVSLPDWDRLAGHDRAAAGAGRTCQPYVRALQRRAAREAE